MKLSKIILLGMLACTSLTAFAEFTVIVRAHEVALSDFRAPASANGITAFKPCRQCALLTVRVTPDTHYVLNNKIVQLADFRTALSTVTSRENETVIVNHHLKSDTVTAISITL
jgi:biopolymer transport protein ExbD